MKMKKLKTRQWIGIGIVLIIIIIALVLFLKPKMPFTIRGEDWKCDITPRWFPEAQGEINSWYGVVEKGTYKTITCADGYCATGSCLINVFKPVWNMLFEGYKDTFISASDSDRWYQIYCCPHKECNTDADCYLWGFYNKCVAKYTSEYGIGTYWTCISSVPTCDGGWVGEARCNTGKTQVIQTYENLDCQTESKVKYTCDKDEYCEKDHCATAPKELRCYNNDLWYFNTITGDRIGTSPAQNCENGCKSGSNVCNEAPVKETCSLNGGSCRFTCRSDESSSSDNYGCFLTKCCFPKQEGAKCFNEGDYFCSDYKEMIKCVSGYWANFGKTLGQCDYNCVDGNKICDGNYLKMCQNGNYVSSYCEHGCDPLNKICKSPEECVEGSTCCEGEVVYKCIYGQWVLGETCDYKCEGAICDF